LKKATDDRTNVSDADTEKSFSIYCDALGERLGCVLMPDGHMEAYA
jgi:hypothetical protein